MVPNPSDAVRSATYGVRREVPPLGFDDAEPTVRTLRSRKQASRASPIVSTATLHRPVRIGTFNLHHGAPPGRRFDRIGIRDAARRLGVELLALQEVDRRVSRSCFSDGAALVAKATGLHPTFARARRLELVGEYGIALLTREPPTAVEVLRLPAFGSEQRLAIVASVVLGGVSVSVASVHLHNRRWIAAQQLPVVLERLTARPGPHLLLGDLNAGPEVLGPAITAAGFDQVVAPPTFPTRAPTDHIDWIAYRGLRVTDPEVPRIWASDHFPLVATVH